MEILDSTSDLRKTLESFTDRDIFIISAFASGTNGTVTRLLEKKNKVSLLVGTQHYFTDSEFIIDCVKTEKKNSSLKLFVDFRGNDSLHWKLYLISPDIVIIGSANFTGKGMALKHDTCVQIANPDLYVDYLNDAKEMLKTTNILDSKHNDFAQKLSEYEIIHKRMKTRLNGLHSFESLEDYLSAESTRIIPVYTYEKELTLKEEKGGKDLQPDLKLFACEKKKPRYQKGDLILSCKSSGANAKFVRFESIEFSEKINQYCIYQSKSREKQLFPLKPLKLGLKKLAPRWFDSEIEALTTVELNQLLQESSTKRSK